MFRPFGLLAILFKPFGLLAILLMPFGYLLSCLGHLAYLRSCLGHLAYLLQKAFRLFGFPIFLILSVSDEGYSRNDVVCTKSDIYLFVFYLKGSVFHCQLNLQSLTQKTLHYHYNKF